MKTKTIKAWAVVTRHGKVSSDGLYKTKEDATERAEHLNDVLGAMSKVLRERPPYCVVPLTGTYTPANRKKKGKR